MVEVTRSRPPWWYVLPGDNVSVAVDREQIETRWRRYKVVRRHCHVSRREAWAHAKISPFVGVAA